MRDWLEARFLFEVALDLIIVTENIDHKSEAFLFIFVYKKWIKKKLEFPPHPPFYKIFTYYKSLLMFTRGTFLPHAPVNIIPLIKSLALNKEVT